MSSLLFFFFFFNDTATTEIYTLSLHDALPISLRPIPFLFKLLRTLLHCAKSYPLSFHAILDSSHKTPDRKSTRLNSSHVRISYAVFCLKKKKKNNMNITLYRKQF